MSRMRLAVMTSCFQQPLRTAIHSAADCRVTGVTLDVRNEATPVDFSATARRELLHALGEVGLRVASTTFPLRRPLANADQLEARVAALKHALEFSYQLQASVMSVRPGPLPPEDSSEHAVLIEVLNDLAAHANQVGATLALTLGRDDPARWVAVRQQVTRGPLGFHFDPAILVMAGHEVVDVFSQVHAEILQVQGRDAIRDLDGGGREVIVGRGDVAWDELLALLDQAQYRGWLTIERTAGEDRIADCARAVRFITNVLCE